MGGMDSEEKHQLWKSVRRIEGQVGGIGKMIEANQDCADVLMQINAAMSALKSIGRTLLAQEAKMCTRSEAAQEKYVKLLKRFF